MMECMIAMLSIVSKRKPKSRSLTKVCVDNAYKHIWLKIQIIRT